jgi:hypothetical protein
MQGFEYFGRIEAANSEKQLKCLVVENPDQVFELYERNLMARETRDHAYSLKYLMESKFKYLPKCHSLI